MNDFSDIRTIDPLNLSRDEISSALAVLDAHYIKYYSAIDSLSLVRLPGLSGEVTELLEQFKHVTEWVSLLEFYHSKIILVTSYLDRIKSVLDHSLAAERLNIIYDETLSQKMKPASLKQFADHKTSEISSKIVEVVKQKILWDALSNLSVKRDSDLKHHLRSINNMLKSLAEVRPPHLSERSTKVVVSDSFLEDKEKKHLSV